MSLYKYVPPDRLDVLRNLRTRFTQANAQNDPFEFRPLVTRWRRPEVSAQILSESFDRRFSEGMLEQYGQPRMDYIKRKWPALLTSLKVVGLMKAEQQSESEVPEKNSSRTEPPSRNIFS